MSVANKPPTKRQRVKKPVQAVVRAMSAEKPTKAEVLSARSKFSKPLFDLICSYLEKGETLSEILRRPDMPTRQGFSDWANSDESLALQVARARATGFDAIADQALEIANTPKTGITTKTDKDGTTITEEDMLGHRRLQIETRLKLLAKWDPKRYGDKLLHTGADGESPLTIEFYMPANGRDSGSE